MITKHEAQFHLGCVVRHTILGYRAIVVDVDAHFQADEAWLEASLLDEPSQHEPWYHLLIDGMVYWAYAAESHLENDDSGDPIEHPELSEFFAELDHGVYASTLTTN